MINKIIQGDALTILKTLPAKSIDMCITSPPYWGLRDYGLEPMVWDGDKNCEHEWRTEITKRPNQSGGKGHMQDCNIGSFVVDYNKRETQSNFCIKCSAWKGSLGLEPDFKLYIKHLCDIFDEVKRVLKKTGTCWVVMGDTYAGGGGWTGVPDDWESVSAASKQDRFDSPTRQLKSMSKCLLQIPSRFAIEMADRGWTLRNEIIWHKPNCMPSSADDRFTVDFEKIYYFVRSSTPQFWTNEKTMQLVTTAPTGINGLEGIDWEWRQIDDSWQRPSRDEIFKTPERQKSTYAKAKTKKVSLWTAHDYYFERQFEKYDKPMDRWGGEKLSPKKELCDKCKGRGCYYDYGYEGKNEYYHECEKCSSTGYKIIKADWDKGTGQDTYRDRNMRPSEQGRNKRCVWKITLQSYAVAHFATFPEKLIETPIKAGCPEGGTVLDPFFGSGTTGIVAKKLNRKYLGIELNVDYIKLAEKRLRQEYFDFK